MAGNEPTNMAEVQERARIRAEERALLEEEQARAAEIAGERDKAFRALVVAVTLAVAIGVPFLAAVIGLAVRLFLWAGGFR